VVEATKCQVHSGFSGIFSEGRRYTIFFSFVKTLKNHYLSQQEEIVSRINPQGRRCGQQSLVIDMTYTARHISNYFLERAEREGQALTQMKLQKLVYIAYGWYLALTNSKLFEDRIEAWQHGPVIPDLYEEFKNFGREPITVKSIEFDLDSLEATEPTVPEHDENTQVILDRVWESYKRFSSAALRSKTHEADTPWSRVYDPDKRNQLLRDEDIGEHFRDKIREYLAEAA
jgi:uncharacterized phage-associated protein